MSTTRVLVDLDIYIYKICSQLHPVFYWIQGEWYNTKKEALDACITLDLTPDDITKQECNEAPWRVPYVIDNTITKINTQMDKLMSGREYEIIYIIGGEGNYRKELDESYKAHRGQKPFYAEYVKEHLKEQTGAICIKGVESDDVIALVAEMDLANTVIVSLDKDLRNLPCNHYNPDSEAYVSVDSPDGARSFLRQIVTGDSVDNIKGIPGLGKVASETVVDNLPELTWDCFLRNLELLCAEKNKVFDKDRILLDVLLLDVGLFWSRRLGIKVPKHLTKLYAQTYKEVSKCL